jgi:hypothetical protein
MDPILEMIMQLFQGVPQEAQTDSKGRYQDSMDPLNDSLDTAQNLYSTLGFNLQDLLIPPAPADPWQNDYEVTYGSNPLYASIFDDIRSGTADPITSVQRLASNAIPVDSAGVEVDMTDPRNASKVVSYVVQDQESGQTYELPVKVWNEKDPVTGATTALKQIDVDALQGVADGFSKSFAEGLRYEAEQPDYGTYTALDDAGGPEAINDLKSRYAMQQMKNAYESTQAPQQGDPGRPEGRWVYPKVPFANMDGRANPGRQPQSSNSATFVPNVMGMMTPDKPAPKKLSEGTRTQTKAQTAAYSKEMDKIVARSGGRVTRLGADRQRQIDTLKAVLAMPQIMNGA